MSSNFEFLHSLAIVFTANVPFFLKVAATFCPVYAFLASQGAHTLGFNAPRMFLVFLKAGNKIIRAHFV